MGFFNGFTLDNTCALAALTLAIRKGNTQMYFLHFFKEAIFKFLLDFDESSNDKNKCLLSILYVLTY